VQRETVAKILNHFITFLTQANQRRFRSQVKQMHLIPISQATNQRYRDLPTLIQNLVWQLLQELVHEISKPKDENYDKVLPNLLKATVKKAWLEFERAPIDS
jgi:vacuolar-type H+-ATPase subunit E/Vma4